VDLDPRQGAGQRSGRPDVHLIGIAVDITEQRHLAQRSEVADLRLRTAIESISESFVLWDAEGRLVMCNTKFQQDNGLSTATWCRATSRGDREAHGALRA
jgi:two-component system, cell cycle sensor histidine kinase PleC